MDAELHAVGVSSCAFQHSNKTSIAPNHAPNYEVRRRVNKTK